MNNVAHSGENDHQRIKSPGLVSTSPSAKLLTQPIQTLLPKQQHAFPSMSLRITLNPIIVGILTVPIFIFILLLVETIPTLLMTLALPETERSKV